MHIAYFSNQFADSEGHGLARYSHQLYSSLSEIRPDLKVTPVAAWSSRNADGVRQLRQAYGLQLLPWGRRWTPLAWAFLDRPPIEHWLDNPVDVVHAVSLGYPIATRKPYVVTVHDIGPLTHPEFFLKTSPWIMKRSLKQAVDKADAIICVSRSTAEEVESYVGRNLTDRIHVIHEGVAPHFFEKTNSDCLASLKKLPVNGVPFILATGKISPRKNVVRIIQALSKISDIIPHHLVLVGGSGWDMAEVVKEINNPAVAHRIHRVGYVSDEQLRDLYSLASLYVHPSLYEGFGLTVLEAMAAGCPVVTSNIYSLPEVTGDAALLVDPYKVDEIAGAIQAICLDDSLERDLVRRGRTRAINFTWDRCAGKVAEVYRSVI
ncbi:MAG: glycosyltransferase family 4 protein [Desulfobacteraceae bacterium]|nr:glycosyltransferase family 4 protein [Desulfobacteraceae bacterium]MBC2757660.1 glycosyltransferase family 4 protein [Desulfobacteraceae bacterium]MBC2763905.1 glycosyltransferase family 4 protein [ANME-2 cluster archaeon]